MSDEHDEAAVKRLAWELCEAEGYPCSCRKAPKDPCPISLGRARRAIELGAVPPPAPRDPVDELAEELYGVVVLTLDAAPRSWPNNSWPTHIARAIAAYVHANFTRKAP